MMVCGVRRCHAGYRIEMCSHRDQRRMAQSKRNTSGLGLIHDLSLSRSDRTELLDEAVNDLAELDENLRDIRRVNRLLGGTSTVLRHLPRLLATMPPRTEPVSILDLAT